MVSLKMWPLCFGALAVLGCTRYVGELREPPQYAVITSYEAITPAMPPGFIDRGIFDASKEYSLTEIVDLGLKRNPSTAQAWASVRINQAALTSAISGLYPTADLSFTYQQTHGTVAADTGSLTYTEWGPQLSINYSILNLQTFPMITAAESNLNASQWQYDSAIQSVMLTVMQSYYNFQTACALLEANKALRDTSKVNYEMTEALFQSGLKTGIDVSQAKADYLNYEMQLEQQKGAVEVARGSLLSSLNLPMDTKIQIAPLPDKIPVQSVEESLNELVDKGLKRRPDLAAARAMVTAAKAQVYVAQSEFYPSISFNFSPNWDAQNITEPQPSSFSSSWGYQGSISVSMPLYSGYSSVANLRSAKASLSQAEAEAEITEQQVQLGIMQAFYVLKTASANVLYAADYLKYADETYQAMVVSYKAGRSPLIDLLQAQSTLEDARTKEISARSNWLTALSSLTFATGCLTVDGVR